MPATARSSASTRIGSHVNRFVTGTNPLGLSLHSVRTARSTTRSATRVSRLFACVLLALGASAAHAIDRYVATTGNDAANDCSVSGTPCLTLQAAINQAVANDTINVAAGTYSVAGLVTVNKTLTLRGAQNGVDARTRAGSESILSNTQGMSVSASNVVIDGFTIQDSSNAAFTGMGVWLNPGIDGTQFVNNIVQNNIIGLGLANLGTTQAVVRHNLFRTNNLAGGAGGSGIYGDPFTSGAIVNVLVDENTFSDNDNAGIGISTDASNVSTNLVITNNLFDLNGRGIYVSGGASIMIRANTLTNTTAPADGGVSSAISAFGAVTGMSILDNVLQTGLTNGIRVADFIGTGNTNTGVEVHGNNISGFAAAGLVNQDTVSVNATCNWWGAANGPANAGNPGGTGDDVVGLATFVPFLIAPAPSACGVVAPSVPVPATSSLVLLLMALALGAIGYMTLARPARR